MKKAFLDREWYLKRPMLWTLILAMVLFLAWMPIKLALYPAAVLGDSTIMLNQAAGARHIINNYSVLYVVLLRCALLLGTALHLSRTAAVFLFAEVQSFIVALALAWSLLRLLRNKAPLWLAGVGFLFFALEPVIPVYSVSILIDPFFAVSFLVFTLMLWEIARSNKCPSIRQLIVLACAGIALALFRNQGIYSVMIALIIAAIVLRAARWRMAVVALICGGLVFSLLWVVFPALQMQGRATDPYGVMIQQVARVMATGKELTPLDERFIAHIMPLEDWKKLYSPDLVDPIKWSPTFDNSYFAAHQKRFLSTWYREFLRYPGVYFQAGALQTKGFWDPFVSKSGQYAETRVAANSLGIARTDLLQKATGIDIASVLSSENMVHYFIPPGMLVWLTVLVAVVIVVRKRARLLVSLVPALSMLLIFFAATPLAYSLRYVISLVFLLPSLVYLPFDTMDSVQKEQSGKNQDILLAPERGVQA